MILRPSLFRCAGLHFAQTLAKKNLMTPDALELAVGRPAG
jgi:hypothetical protein